MWPIVDKKRPAWFFLFLFLLTSCSSSPDVIKIGLVAPFEGANRAIGYDVIYSARLAVRQINEQGGINGTMVALVALDDSGDVNLARETAVALTLDPAVVAVIGHWDDEITAVVTPIYDQADLAFLPMTSADQDLSFPDAFQTAYEEVTPFDETPAEYAYPLYQRFQELWQTLQETHKTHGVIYRESIRETILRNRNRSGCGKTGTIDYCIMTNLLQS